MGSNWTVLILMLISCEGGDLTGESKREQYRTGSLTVMVVMRLMVMVIVIVIKTVEVMIRRGREMRLKGGDKDGGYREKTAKPRNFFKR